MFAGDVIGVALLQDEEAVVDVADFVRPVPCAAGPGVFAADAFAAEAVIAEVPRKECSRS